MPKIEYTKAIIIGIALKNELQYLLFYIQESTILFLYTVLNYESRSTTDIDFMLRRMSNDVALQHKGTPYEKDSMKQIKAFDQNEYLGMWLLKENA